jgi:hypothetical protein
MLTVLFLQSLANAGFMYVPGVEVKKAGESNPRDLDIVASCDGRLILAECKDLRGGLSSRTMKDVISQLRDIIDIALDIRADIVILSVLLTDPPEALQNSVAALNRRLGQSLAVHLLTGTDLELGYKPKPATAGTAKASAEAEHCSLRDFLPIQQLRKSGRVEEPGTRSVSF